jgi:hypothetical protein
VNASFLEKPRDVTAGWHYLQTKAWLEYDNGRNLDNVLVYASFELRMAIERYWFRLLALLAGGKIGPEQEKRCKTKDGLLSEIKKEEPNIRKRIEFSNAALAAYPFIPKHPAVDMKFLIRSWNDLSQYCHKYLRPTSSWDSQNREFQRNGFMELKKVFDYMTSLLYPNVAALLSRDDLAPEIGDLLDKYMADEISLGQVERRLDLMEPILSQRYRFKPD